MARRLGLALVLLPALVILLVLLGVGLAQTAPGRRLLAQQIGDFMSSPEIRVELAGLEGPISFDMRLERLTVADPEGVWLEAADARLSWSPSALLRGRVEIRDLSVREIDVERLPPSPEDEEPQEPPRLPELPEWLPPVTVERLALERLNLAQPVLGEAASFALEGYLATVDDGRAAVLHLDAGRLDEQTATASVQARLELEPAALDLMVTVEETGGMLGLITGRPAAGDLEVSLAGAGPLEAWRGQLTMEAQGLLRADATIALEQLARIRIAGRVHPAEGLLPPPLAPLAGERIDIALNASRPAPQQLGIERLLVGAAAAELRARGSIDLERQRIDLESELAAADLSAFSSLAGQPLAGRVELSLSATGPMTEPRGRLGLDAGGLAFADVSARSATADLEYTVLEPLDSSEGSARIDGSGRIQGLTLPAGASLPPRDVDWRLGVSGRADGPITFEELAVESDPLRLTGEGTIDARTLAGQVTVALEAGDLRPLTAPFGQPIDGRLQLSANASIAGQARRIEIELEGDLENLAGLPDAARSLLGAAPKLSVTGLIEPERRFEVTRFEISGAEAEVDGRLAMALPQQAIDGEVALRLPRLAAFAQAIGQDLAGAIEASARIGGSVGSPEVALHADGVDLVLAGQPLQRMVLDATGRNLLAAPEGSIELTAAVAVVEAALATGYRLEGERLELSNLSLTGPQSLIEGEAAIDLAGPLVNGRLRGGIEDLSAWQPLLPLALRGRVDLDAQLRADDGRQAAILRVALADLGSPFGQAQRMGLQASVEDVLGAPALDATLTAAELRQDDLVVSSARLGATGTVDALALTAAAAGTAVEDFDLTAQAGLGLGQTTRLRLEQLDGRFAGETLRLAQPAELTVAESDLRIAGLDLRLGRAALQGDITLGPQEVEGEMRLSQLPLALLGRFGAPELDGQAGATMRLGGAVDNPSADLGLEIAGVRLADPNLRELPALRLTAKATLADRRLAGSARAEGVSDRPLTASFDLPLVVRLQPVAVELPRDGAVGGRLDGELRLGRLAELLLDDQALEGLLTAAFEIDGTIAAPRVDGSLRLTDGSYANGTTGTVLRNLTVVADASNERITIHQLSATDGGDGRIEGQGEIGFGDGVQMDVRVQARQARLVRRDDADASLGADLRLQGTASAPRLAGEVTVERAEIRIPDSVGPSVPVIEVERIGADSGAEAPSQPRADPLLLRLDTDVRIPGQLFVRGRGLESEWEGALEVTGTASEPSITGELRVRRGHFDFIDRRFQLTDSTIEFTGASPPDPLLNIVATATAGDLTAIIRVTGPASAPEFSFESQPPLPQDEVLSRLLFNRPLSEIGPVQAAQLAFAVNRLRGGRGLDVLGEIRSRLGVDTLDVVTGDRPEDGASVRAGRYLNDDVYVELERGTGQRSGRARVEVEILPNVSVEADTGEDARSGIGLRWRFDY